METIIFAIMAAAFIIVIVAKDIYNSRVKRKKFERNLRELYGNYPRKEIKLERFARIGTYFKKHPEEGQIDDVTWNDLGMDEIFALINHTNSASGEEYLYYTLRSCGKSLEQLGSVEEETAFFMTHEEERVKVQLLLAKLGYTGKYSLYDYIDNLDYLGERSNLRTILVDLGMLTCVAFMPFFFSYAFIAFLGLMIFHIVKYYEEKGEIEPYIISFVYVLKLVSAGHELEKISDLKKSECLREKLEKARELTKKLTKMEKGSFLVTSGNGSLGGNPMDLIMDYLKMTFHLDLLKFNSMLSFLRKEGAAVDELNTILGELETVICIGSFRKHLEMENGYCVPKLWEGDASGFVMEEGYHPLLTAPVKNSLRTDRGILLTGSNASGKSTFLKTIAINAILAQTIHTCTAARYEAPCYRIYSSMSLRDDVQGGDSYYIVEIKALKRILNAAKEEERPVLCFVDEVLRGTNTVERIAASTQVLKSLRRRNVLCMAATHDIELTELLKNDFDNYHFEEEIKDGDVTFQYRLLKGKATTRNAIKLLEIIGYDEKIVREATDMAQRFLDDGIWSNA